MLANASVEAAAAFRVRSLPISRLLQGHLCSVSAMCTSTQQKEQYLAAVAERFQEAPETAAKSLVDSLSCQHRSILLEALGSQANGIPRAYVDKLFQEADKNPPLQQLDKYACTVSCCLFLATGVTFTGYTESCCNFSGRSLQRP